MIKIYTGQQYYYISKSYISTDLIGEQRKDAS